MCLPNEAFSYNELIPDAVAELLNAANFADIPEDLSRTSITAHIDSRMIALDAFVMSESDRANYANSKTVHLFSFFPDDPTETRRLASGHSIAQANYFADQAGQWIVDRWGCCVDIDFKTHYQYDDSGYAVIRNVYESHEHAINFQEFEIYLNDQLIRTIWFAVGIQQFKKPKKVMGLSIRL